MWSIGRFWPFGYLNVAYRDDFKKINWPALSFTHIESTGQSPHPDRAGTKSAEVLQESPFWGWHSNCWTEYVYFCQYKKPTKDGALLYQTVKYSNLRIKIKQSSLIFYFSFDLSAQLTKKKKGFKTEMLFCRFLQFNPV